MVSQKPCQKGQGGESQQDVVPCPGKDPHFAAYDPSDYQKNNRNKQNDRHNICPLVRYGPQTYTEGFIPQDVMGAEKQRHSQQCDMEYENHESENRLQTHGSTAPRDDPVKDRFKTPGKTSMVVKHLILFAAESEQQD